jgi:hypothetical protein
MTQKIRLVRDLSQMTTISPDFLIIIAILHTLVPESAQGSRYGTV